MSTGIAPLIAMAFLSMPMQSMLAQQTNEREHTAPIYHVTVIERTAKAINYQYRSGPTKVDFRGTVLLPRAEGEAIVESRQGRVEIEAKLVGLAAPQRFGNQYLSYVLWAVTPEGRPHNIGELVPDGSDKARIHVSTDLQAFALLVTAEPYSAVRQPSDLVVAENEVRPDTDGRIEPVEAKFELLPRGEYTWHVSNGLGPAVVNAPKVSMHEYEAVLEVYQAQNAVNIAGSANAEHYAPDTLARARQLLTEAQQLHDSKSDYRRTVEVAREAAQTAEDARMISQRRQEAEQLQSANSELSRTQAELSNARQEKQQVLEEAQRVQARANAAIEQAQVARDQAESEVNAARAQASEARSRAQASSVATVRSQQELELARKRDLRMQLFEDSKRLLPTLDTARGLVVAVPDDGFSGAALRQASSDQVARIAGIVCKHPGLHVSVEGHSDSAAKEFLSRERADAVRQALVANGVGANAVSAASLGDSRPVGPNATPQGKKENSRVEIVIAGDSIGSLPLWERTYSLTGSTSHPSGRPQE